MMILDIYVHFCRKILTSRFSANFSLLERMICPGTSAMDKNKVNIYESKIYQLNVSSSGICVKVRFQAKYICESEK